MEPIEHFMKLKEIYEKDIKPNIISEYYVEAGIEMNKFVGIMKVKGDYQKIIQTYHNGIKLLTSAEELENELLKEDICDSKIKKKVDEVEAYMAQLGLAIKSGNRF